MIRPPAVAGRFYPSDREELVHQITKFTSDSVAKAEAIACMVPHAGYPYSGHVAGAVFESLRLPSRFLLLGPRHFPKGDPLAIMCEGGWETPLGIAQIDSELAIELKGAFPRLRDEEVAHQSEHSLEVQLPFLQVLARDFSFVPVVLGTDRYPILEELGTAIASVIGRQRSPALIVASSDMNHYESDGITRVKDQMAIEQILAMDARRLYDTVRLNGISMCGYAATVAMLVAARSLGATQAEMVQYATSGDVTGDREHVVGYAGVIIR
jgi:MEMO1 family protein